MNPLKTEQDEVVVKKEVVEEEQESAPILTMLAEDDRYIADRMKSQPKTLDDVLLVKEKRYSPGEHRLTLPKEFKPYENKLSFRWLNKKKRSIDDAIIKGWIIVNKTIFPDIAKKSKYLFSTSGAVERGDAVLACIKKEIAESIRKAPGVKSSAYLKSQLNKGTTPLPKGQSGFYKPEDTTEKEDETGVGKGYQEGRDF
jgi:hypothetical protein